MIARVLGGLAVAIAVILATACGDNVAEPGGDPIPVPRSDAMAVLPSDLPIVCQSTQPGTNDPCQAEGSTCEYGKSPDQQCNKTLACVTSDNFGLGWVQRATDPCFKLACPTEPAGIETLDNQPCSLPAGADAGPTTDADEAVCPMTNGICACTTGAGGSDVHERRWVCIRPDVGGCPVDRPRVGAGCSGKLWCDYGSCKWKRGLLMECKDNHWVSGGAPCN